MMPLETEKFALAGGLFAGTVTAFVTMAGLARMPGSAPFTRALAEVYGPYDYSVTPKGGVVGAGLSFLEGFISFGILAVLYNTLIEQKGGVPNPLMASAATVRR